MNDLSRQRQQRWQQIVVQLQKEYRNLPTREKDWIRARLQEVEQLQRELDALFRRSGGEAACADCEGACCAKGHNHMLLPNLLVYLQREQLPPAADFTLTCPWLRTQGCVLGTGERPYNCITFLCDKLEERLSSREVEEFYRLDQDLRRCYHCFAERYAGGGMSGLLLQAERLAGQPYLQVRERS